MGNLQNSCVSHNLPWPQSPEKECVGRNLSSPLFSGAMLWKNLRSGGSWLDFGILTAVTWVRFPDREPTKKETKQTQKYLNSYQGVTPTQSPQDLTPPISTHWELAQPTLA